MKKTGKRSATIVCLNYVELLVLHKDTFRKINKLCNMNMIYKRKFLLENIPGFLLLPQNETTETLLFHFKVITV